ncbi:MAG: DinB family protein [Tepidiformaceae bacterium]
MLPAVDVYLAQTIWLLAEFEKNLRALPESALHEHPPASDASNAPLAIGHHAAQVTRAYALGMGCGFDVERDRSTEFDDGPLTREGVVEQLQSVSRQVAMHFPRLDDAHLDSPFTPAQSLYGTGTPRVMTPREAIVENIRHLGIHLGELRLTVSLLNG